MFKHSPAVIRWPHVSYGQWFIFQKEKKIKENDAGSSCLGFLWTCSFTSRLRACLQPPGGQTVHVNLLVAVASWRYCEFLTATIFLSWFNKTNQFSYRYFKQLSLHMLFVTVFWKLGLQVALYNANVVLFGDFLCSLCSHCMPTLYECSVS